MKKRSDFNQIVNKEFGSEENNTNSPNRISRAQAHARRLSQSIVKKYESDNDAGKY